MLSDSIRRWNPWWVSGDVNPDLKGIERQKLADINRYTRLRNVKDIIGVRRSGKTVLLYQIIQSLISKGVRPQDIVFLNFDDNNIYNASFDKLLAECKKINPNVTHIFLDEVQEKRDWEKWVRTIYDTREFKQIFVSGSSSSLIGSEVSRVLTGRHTSFILFPFSFREYLQFHNWESFDPFFLEGNKLKLLHFVEKYIFEGGFPETLGMDAFERNRYLNDLFNDIVSRDILARHKIDYHITKKIAYYLISHSSKRMSYRSIANACNVAVDTAIKYISFINDTFLVLTLRKFSSKLKEQLRSNNKYYAVDSGLASAAGYRINNEPTRLMENVVFIELMRRYIENKKIQLFYWQDTHQREVDFLVKEGPKVMKLIQVCYNVDAEDTKKREIKPLLAAMTQFKLKEGTIITFDHEQDEKIGTKIIKFIPLWKWLLE